MAHELRYNHSTGSYSMMYVGEPPWHGLGTKLDRPATAKEAVEAAQLNWRVTKLPVGAFDESQQTFHHIENKYATVKESNGSLKERAVLGLVSGAYCPLQNIDAFEFFDPIVGRNAAVYQTAGALFNGERIWILAKMPDSIKVVGEDITDKYLLLSNSHDGQSAVQITFTPIRVVCCNTLILALSKGQLIRVAHRKSMEQRLRQAADLLNIINTGFEVAASTFRAMSKIKINRNRLNQYLKRVFPVTISEERQEVNPSVCRARVWAEYFFDNGAGNHLRGVSGTLWAAYNGITEYVDHCLGRQDSNSRLNSVWFGEGRSVKIRAFSEAERLMHAWRN